MANLATILKGEIARIARKATKEEFSKLRKDVVRLKRDAADLKRRVVKLERVNRQLADLAAEHRQKQVKATEPELASARINSRVIINIRKRLGLSQPQLAKLVGVSAPTISYWETKQGKIAFRGSTKARILEVRKLTKREIKRFLAEEKAKAAAAKAKRKTAKKKQSVKKTRAKKA